MERNGDQQVHIDRMLPSLAQQLAQCASEDHFAAILEQVERLFERGFVSIVRPGSGKGRWPLPAGEALMRGAVAQCQSRLERQAAPRARGLTKRCDAGPAGLAEEGHRVISQRMATGCTGGWEHSMQEAPHE
jgi:hypothetical protein